MSERVEMRAQYCEKCGVLLWSLEEWARVCVLHMTDAQARVIADKAIRERNPHADR